MLGVDEGGVEAPRKPRVLPHELFPQHHGVHDREDPGLLVVGALGTAEVREEAIDALPERGGPAGADEGVELPRGDHVPEVPVAWYLLEPDLRRKGHVDLLQLLASA